jgi:hypothetical protein
MSKRVSPYVGLTFGLLTQHEKEHVLDPILRAGLGARVVRVEGFDTDLLGTFTGERARVGTQREAARAKADRAVALSGLPVGLGSEGAFTTDPMTGLLPLDVELVLAWDARDGVEVVGRASSPDATAFRRRVTDLEALETLAREVGFPEQGLVLEPDGAPEARVKGVADWDTLETAALAALDRDVDLWVEAELRAHLNPRRRVVIAAAAADLVARLGTPCPACGGYGFGRVRVAPGRPCVDCGTATARAAAEVWGCPRCAAEQTRSLPGPGADSAECPSCNP